MPVSGFCVFNVASGGMTLLEHGSASPEGKTGGKAYKVANSDVIELISFASLSESDVRLLREDNCIEAKKGQRQITRQSMTTIATGMKSKQCFAMAVTLLRIFVSWKIWVVPHWIQARLPRTVLIFKGFARTIRGVTSMTKIFSCVCRRSLVLPKIISCIQLLLDC